MQHQPMAFHMHCTVRFGIHRMSDAHSNGRYNHHVNINISLSHRCTVTMAFLSNTKLWREPYKVTYKHMSYMLYKE